MLFIRSVFSIFLISQTFSWLLGLMSSISSIRGTSGFPNFKTKIWWILVILMLSERSSLYVTNPKTFIILKDPSLVKSNLLLNLVVRINIIFIFGVLYRRYTLFFFSRVSPLTLFLSANFFIFLLKKVKSYHNFFGS